MLPYVNIDRASFSVDCHHFYKESVFKAPFQVTLCCCMNVHVCFVIDTFCIFKFCFQFNLFHEKNMYKRSNELVRTMNN